MALNTTAKNLMLTELASVATHMALFNGSGVELSGGDPAYARQALTWGTASSGEIAITNDPVFNVPAGATVSEVRFFSAVTAGTEYASYDVTDEVYASQGTYTVTSATIDLNK